VGAVHASGNSVALLLYASSYRSRRREHHLRGAALALAGGSVAMFTGYLGGHLSFARGVGVGPRGLEDSRSEPSASGSGARTGDPAAPTSSSSDGAVWTPQPPVAEVSGAGHADLMGIDQVAQELTVPVAQVHNMVDQGLLPAASTDPLRFRAEDVQAVRLQGG
jgi:hypothetical protein